MSLLLRPATPEDAKDIAQLVNIAVEGMPLAFWSDQSNVGQSPLEVGIKRCMQSDTATSYLRITVAELDSQIVGMRLCYELRDLPDQMDGSVHPMFRPMIKLVSSVAQTGSINTIGVYPEYQRNGVGTALLKDLEAKAHFNEAELGLLMTDANKTAHAFSEGRNYRVTEKAPVIKGSWETPASHWQLRRRLHS